jgi:ribosomal protein S18 acetylase RimI-like enzyme
VSSVPRPAFRLLREDDLTRPDIVGFACGDEPWAREIAEILTSGRAWYELHRTPGQVTLLYCHDHGDGEVIGFANVVLANRVIRHPDSREKLPTMHLAYFGIGEKHQGRGHAKRMLAGLEHQARKAGLLVIDLFVHEHNQPAINLYLGRGYSFVEGGRRIPADYGGDYLRMMKLLMDQKEMP